MWVSSVGVLIPHSKDVLDTDKSFKPDSTNLITSFLFEVGLMKFGLFLYGAKVAKDFFMRNNIGIETHLIKNCDHHIPIEASSIALNYILKKIK